MKTCESFFPTNFKPPSAQSQLPPARKNYQVIKKHGSLSSQPSDHDPKSAAEQNIFANQNLKRPNFDEVTQRPVGGIVLMMK